MTSGIGRCGRCGAAAALVEAEPDAIGEARCAGCAARDERWESRAMAAMLACTTLVVVLSAWQMLTA